MEKEIERLHAVIAQMKEEYTELEASIQALRTRILQAIEKFDKGAD